MTIAFEEFVKQNSSVPPQKMEGYGAIPLEKLTATEKEKAKQILCEDLFKRFDNTAVEALVRLDSNYAIEVFTRFLAEIEIPNGASLDCAKFLFDKTRCPEYADIMVQHLYVSSRFYRRSAINAVSSIPATANLIDGLKAIIFTDTDDVNVFVAAKQLSQRANLPSEEEKLFVKNVEILSGEAKKDLVDRVSAKAVS